MSKNPWSNEPLILSVLVVGDAMSVAEIASRISREKLRRPVTDAAIYLALHRMSKRGLVRASKGTVRSADGKQREVSFFSILAEGRRTEAQYRHEGDIAKRLAGRFA